jgi:hypothetical protein
MLKNSTDKKFIKSSREISPLDMNRQIKRLKKQLSYSANQVSSRRVVSKQNKLNQDIITNSLKTRSKGNSVQRGADMSVEKKSIKDQVSNGEDDNETINIKIVTREDVDREEEKDEVITCDRELKRSLSGRDTLDGADRYKHVAVVDFNNVFSHQDCLLVNKGKQSLSFLNDKSMNTFQFDRVVHSHSSANHIADRLVKKFLFFNKQERDKVVINFGNVYNSENNGGFNLFNFQMDFAEEDMEDIVNDYEKSILGSFISNLLDKVIEEDKYEVFFRMITYDGDQFQNQNH